MMAPVPAKPIWPVGDVGASETLPHEAPVITSATVPTIRRTETRIDVTASHRATPVPVHMVLMGNSYRTKVLVGPLVLTQGVDTTIAWDRSPS